MGNITLNIRVRNKIYPTLYHVFILVDKGRETTEDDPRPGRPSTSKTDENIEKIGKLIREDRRLSIRGLAEISGIDKECVRQILHESYMRKVCEKMVLKTPHSRAKESRMNICADILNNIDTNPGLLDTVTQGDKIENVEAIKAKATEVLNQITERTSNTAFNNGKSRMERCRSPRGGIEGQKFLL
ncbi:hypothetical protein NQ318_020352 [Aromia moschata]|uniref:Uncharacterized protein n=1 Tax=Aromia moschata TaxID=1265417 RepID=A0AAV8XI49_9CUCU|nr:hypothetical protein NQ318_020352 [Aromia moschata]